MRREPPQLFAGEVRAIGAALALALLILAALVASHLGAFLMKRLSILAAVAASSLLAGCAGMPGITGGASTKDFLQHMEACNRHYEGAIGGPSITGSFKIDCSPVGTGLSAPAVAPAATPAPAAP